MDDLSGIPISLPAAVHPGKAALGRGAQDLARGRGHKAVKELLN